MHAYQSVSHTLEVIKASGGELNQEIVGSDSSGNITAPAAENKNNITTVLYIFTHVQYMYIKNA